jgi:phospholipid N-methyltransferase
MKQLSAYKTFIKAAFNNPLQISTLFQTSPWLRDKILDALPLESAHRVCELGPGAGAITEGLKHRLTSQSVYVGIELNGILVDYLKTNYPDLNFIEGSAENAAQIANQNGAFDIVISSLPWTVFSPDLRESIMTSVSKSLRPGGIFCTYLCLNAAFYPSAKHLKSLLDKNFSSVTRSDIEWRNIPPAFIYFCKK